ERGHVAHAGVERVVFDLDSSALELGTCSGDVVDAQQRDGVSRRLELHSEALRLPDPEAGLTDPELVPRTRVRSQAERLDVEPVRSLRVSGRDPDRVDPRDQTQPTEPSICSWISRFISTAYSSGTSFVIGSMNPDTTMAEASSSVRPRLIR